MTALIPNETVEIPQPRNILIAIDLFSDFSENLIAYSLLVTQNTLCDYTLLYCLKTFDTREITEKLLAVFLENIVRKHSFCVNKKIKIIVSSQNLLEAILKLEQEIGFDCVMLNPSNQPNSHTMDEFAQNILFQVPTTFLIIPSNIELTFPTNIGLLVEGYGQSNLEKLNAFNRFISEHPNVFINFVLFANTQEILDQDRKALSEYQSFFDSNFTFTFIVEDQKGYCIFLKCIEENHGNAAVIAWDENSLFFKHFLNNKQISFPCSPTFPIYYPKKKEPYNKTVPGVISFS